MIINIGMCGDDFYTVPKQMSNVVAKDCTVYGECSVMNPSFLLRYFSGIESTTYCEIPDWGKFYYVSDVILMPGKRARIICTEDVLQSKWSQLQNVMARVSRQEKVGLADMYDGEYPVRLTNVINKYKFSVENPFGTGGSYLLTVIGGNGGSSE